MSVEEGECAKYAAAVDCVEGGFDVGEGECVANRKYCPVDEQAYGCWFYAVAVECNFVGVHIFVANLRVLQLGCKLKWVILRCKKVF